MARKKKTPPVTVDTDAVVKDIAQSSNGGSITPGNSSAVKTTQCEKITKPIEEPIAVDEEPLIEDENEAPGNTWNMLFKSNKLTS
ncbi:hypothetical protein BVRB_1g012670 [Beta vulgaris subsp. vulgaris]|nr:hypothetical protein BVRB_1g012670 [Beta vulgaris subsp. vulgaris]